MLYPQVNGDSWPDLVVGIDNGGDTTIGPSLVLYLNNGGSSTTTTFSITTNVTNPMSSVLGASSAGNGYM